MADESQYWDDPRVSEYPQYTMQQNVPTIYDSGNTAAGRDWYSLAGDGTLTGGGTIGPGGGAPAPRLEESFGSTSPANYNYTPPGSRSSTGERGSAYSSYSSGYDPKDPFWSRNMNEAPTPRGTPPTPARSGSFSGPNLPPAQSARLNELLTSPNAITNDPAYKWTVEQGNAALARTAASKKMALSGKANTDAIQWGQGNAMQYLNQLIQQLLGASNASRISQSGSVGADPGTQGEFAARDLIPVIQRMLQGSGTPAPNLPNYGGINPRLADSLGGM